MDIVGTKIGRIIGYRKRPDYSIFSKVRKRAEPEIFEELNNWILQDRLNGRQIRLIAQGSTDVPAFSRMDKYARTGHRIPSKREQEDADGNVNDMFFGYKLHAIADAENEVTIGFYIAPGNRNDKIFFGELIGQVNRKFRLAFGTKYLGDSAYDSTDIHEYLHYHRIKDVIAINGRGHRKPETPKDPEYVKRCAIERIFSKTERSIWSFKEQVHGYEKGVNSHLFVPDCIPHDLFDVMCHER